MRAMASYETRTRRFSRAEYERLIDLGVFQPGEEIELIGGQLVVAGSCSPVGLRARRAAPTQVLDV